MRAENLRRIENVKNSVIGQCRTDAFMSQSCIISSDMCHVEREGVEGLWQLPQPGPPLCAGAGALCVLCCHERRG